MTETIWIDGDPQPGRAVDTVTDIDGDTWERWESDDDAFPDVWAVPFDPDVIVLWDELVKELGPLTDATEDRSEA